MKTTKIYIGHLSLVIGIMLIGAMQAAAVEYKSTYGGYSQPAYGVAVTATAPSATFQSTSAYSEQWANREESPMLNADGSVNTRAYGAGIRKAPGGGEGPGGNGPGTPGGNLDPTTQQPIGDALLPFLIMALAYFVIRRRRTTRP